ncbi:TPA: hypothetical protein P7O61_004924 [Escherichia coli]|nr:hypothetical protein [Escherichia coli]HDP9783174.1 hypothetical protein [Escherichia coli]
MCDSEAEKILFILNKHERAYRRLIPVYIFLAIVLWILPILLIIYLYFCIVDNEFLRIGFCIAWTAYYFLSLFKYFVKYFFPLDREDLLNLMDLAKDSPDAKQELLERLLSGKRMTGRDEMDIKRILKSKRLVRTVLIFTESSDQLSRATDRVPGLPASPGYVQ